MKGVLCILCLCATLPAEDFHAQAVRESLSPIHAGAPFWNACAKQFIWAPAFELKAVNGAASYRFTLTTEPKWSYAFIAKDPAEPLTHVWALVPVGSIDLRVEALDDHGKLLAVVGNRQFHRGAVFNGPYGKGVVPYDESARLALKTLISESFVQSWRATGQPDPQYPLYRYSSKVSGKLLTGCAIYARLSPRPENADQAIEIARAAADFLISITPAEGPLVGLPPTYHGAKPTERENDNWTMMMTPAEAAQGYLDLYDATGDPKYLDAAKRVALGYQKLQLESGTWHLKVDNRTNESLGPVDLIPAEAIEFLDRMVTQYKFDEIRSTLDRAVKWMMENPVKTFNWQAQFDDAKLRGPYANLAKHEACMFAGYLFRHKQIELAEELLRFAEDQFVIWEQPPQSSAKFERIENWFTPCSAEQYAMFEPISGSSAFMIVAYVRAYEATGKPIYLAKAQSLANTLTLAQQQYHGRFPTRMYKTQDRTYWLNSTVNCARAMDMLSHTKAPDEDHQN